MASDVPVVEEDVLIPCGSETLEGILAYPEEEPPRQGFLLLSPHPHMGGRMDNNVIAHLAQQFAAAGHATLRFNYGGVGNSTRAGMDTAARYEFWTQLEAEQDYHAVLPDALAARAFLVRQLAPETQVAYVGYSFGTCMALLLAQVRAPAALGLVAPPVARAPLEGLDSLRSPVCFVVGDQDFAFDAGIFDRFFAVVLGIKEYVTLAGCDHFFRKEEDRVYDALQKFFLNLAEPETSR